ncbi:MAG: hypothetical protein QM683_01725 [Lacrimispora sp.]
MWSALLRLKSNIVQMAITGGAEWPGIWAINPQIALWPCPLWLWNNDGSSGIKTRAENPGNQTVDGKSWGLR